MFGYVKPREGDLRVREYEFYRAAYCGICRRMKKLTGTFSNLSLSYDFVFLALSRMLLTDGKTDCRRCRCVSHPARGRYCLGGNAALDETARISAVLSLEKLRDDLHDERGFRRFRARLSLPVFRHAAKKARLAELSAQLRARLSALSRAEAEKTPSLDLPADLFGELLGDVFCFGIPEEYRDVYRAVGYHLGRYIYTADAVDDYDDDKKRGSYNPCVLLYPGGMPEDVLKTGMFLELDALAKEVEKLPFGQFGAVKEILRNTVYLGLADRTHALFSPKPKKGKTRDERSL